MTEQTYSSLNDSLARSFSASVRGLARPAKADARRTLLVKRGTMVHAAPSALDAHWFLIWLSDFVPITT